MPELPQLEYIIRIVGRLGFMTLLYGAYQLWHMPVLKKHSNEFFWLATVVCILSLGYTIIEYHFLALPNAVYSIIFNVITTWILAIHLNYRAYKIKRRVGREKIDAYSTEIDRKIAEIKETSTPK